MRSLNERCVITRIEHIMMDLENMFIAEGVERDWHIEQSLIDAGVALMQLQHAVIRREENKRLIRSLFCELYDNQWLWRNYRYVSESMPTRYGIPYTTRTPNYAMCTFGDPETGKMQLILRRNGHWELWEEKPQSYSPAIRR